ALRLRPPYGRPRLFDLDQLDRLAARTFDHGGTRVAEPVRALQESDALAAQLGDPGIEIGDAERDVIVEVAARADQRLVALAHVPGQRHVADGDGGGRDAERSLGLEPRPAAISPARDRAIGLGA